MESNFDYNYTTTWTPDQAAAAGAAGGLFAGGMMLFMFIMIVAMYVLMALPLMKIAQKSAFKEFNDKAWWAWVPVLNLVLNYNMGGYSGWWMLLPVGNVIVLILSWMKISVKCGKPDWLGILMIVSPLNIIIPFYLAYGSDK
ncbi:MAG: DUF5684 domain-containing protein [Patescibacteria group bacterium]|nr:DUF5684 domain-containing protein [Patescibacteria group bacterium]